MCSTRLEIDYPSDDAVVVIASGRIAADRALDLCAAGKRPWSVQSGVRCDRARQGRHRRHVNVCALMLPGTALYEYVRERQTTGAVSVYLSLTDALTALEGPPTGPVTS
jgi:hypothetical protein